LEAVFPYFCPSKREIWHGGADLKSSRLSGQRVTPAGEKPIFGLLSKTGMAALLAGLPVITSVAL